MKNKLFLIIALICMVVPFMTLGAIASAEVVSTIDSEFVFREFYPSFSDGTNFTAYFDTDNGYFYNTLSIPFASDYFLSPFWLPNLEFDLSLNGSPSVTFRGNYTLARFSYPSAVQDMVIETDSYDKRLHSFIILCAVLKDSITPSEYLLFNGKNLYDDCLEQKLNMSFVPDDGLYVSGSAVSSANPSFTFNLFVNSTDPTLGFFVSMFDIYAVTWYGAPQLNFLTSYYDELYIFSYVDMIENSVGYDSGYQAGLTQGLAQGQQQGYQDGFTAGEQQANNTVNTGNASYQAGVTAGKTQANNTVNQGSASYIQGYQDGLSAPEYSFMSLISALFDAPIRAFFGYTENGVTHPGLFSIDILDMNMGAFIASIFSLAVIITIIRLILGGKT